MSGTAPCGIILEFDEARASACSFGSFVPPKPFDIRGARERSNASLADKAGPVRQNIRGTRQPLWQVTAQKRPRLRLRHEARRCGGNMEQDRFNPFHHRKSGKSRYVGARRTQQLSSRAYEGGIIWMLAETQSHGEFFIAQVRVIRREVFGKIALIVASPPEDGTFEQPFASTPFRTATQLADPSQQRRHMNCIAELSSQWRDVQLFNRFHVKTILQRAWRWRIPFRAEQYQSLLLFSR
jgi:hypothetical protein